MTLFTLVKDLIGKEDVDWGDSSTTFSRETHSGGSSTLHYIDAECIPSTTLGGYIGDVLHTQHTDTGTTQTSFTVNSGGNYAKLDTTGLTADRTFTFPDTGDQELIGDTDLASTSNGLGGSLVGVEDSGGLYSATDVEAALAEVATDVAAFAYPRGFMHGFRIEEVSDTAIAIGVGAAHLGSAADYKMVYSIANLTFTCGSGGSNAASDDLGASELTYVYIDESSVTASELTAVNFVNLTEVPSKNTSYNGWYNAAGDRCIGAFRTDSASHVLGQQTIGDLCVYDTPRDEYNWAAAPTNEQSLDLSSSVPKYSRRCKLLVTNYDAVDDGNFTFSIAGTGISGFQIFERSDASQSVGGNLDIILNTDQTVYWYDALNNGPDTGVSLVGYYRERL